MLVVATLSCFLPLLLLARGVQGSWLAPAPAFVAYWGLATLAPLLLLERATVSMRAIIYVAVGAGLFALGATVATAGRRQLTRLSAPTLKRDTALKALVHVGTLSGLIVAALAIRANGFSISQVLSLQGLFSVGNAAAVSRYSGSGSGGPLSSLLLALAYSASLAAPFCRLGSKRLPRLFVVRPLLAITVYSAFTTERLGLLLGVSLTAAGLLGSAVLRDGALPRVSAKRVVLGLFAAALVAIAFVAIAFVRVGEYSPDLAQRIEQKVEVYALGYLPAYSEWQDRYDSAGASTPLGYGTASIAGMSYVTGQDRDATRAYDERAQITSDGVTTNVYTGWRNLILDFGLIGTPLVLGAWGFLSGRAYLAARRGSALGAGLMAASYAVMLMSNTMLVTTFSNVLVALLLGVVMTARAFQSSGEAKRVAAERERLDRYRIAVRPPRQLTR